MESLRGQPVGAALAPTGCPRSGSCLIGAVPLLRALAVTRAKVPAVDNELVFWGA